MKRDLQSARLMQHRAKLGLALETVTHKPGTRCVSVVLPLSRSALQVPEPHRKREMIAHAAKPLCAAAVALHCISEHEGSGLVALTYSSNFAM